MEKEFSYFYISQFPFLQKSLKIWKKIMQYPNGSLVKQQFNILSVEIPQGLVKFGTKQRKGVGVTFQCLLNGFWLSALSRALQTSEQE
jgi:hypothetical protein